MWCLVNFVHCGLSLAVVVVLHRDIDVLHCQLRRIDHWILVAVLTWTRLVLTLAVLLLVYDEMLAIIEELAVVEVAVVILVTWSRIHLADLAVVTTVVGLCGQGLVLRFGVHVLHRKVTLLQPLSRVLFPSATNGVLYRGRKTVLLVRERRTLLHQLLLLLQ